MTEIQPYHHPSRKADMSTEGVTPVIPQGLQNGSGPGLQDGNIQKTESQPYHPSREARNQYTEVLTVILPCLQNDDVQGLQNGDVQKTETPYHPSRKARNQCTEVLPMILPCLQNVDIQGLQNKDVQKRERQPASIRAGNLLTEVTLMIPQGLQKDDIQDLQNGNIQETDHIKKNAKNVDRSCNSRDSTTSPKLRHSKDRNISPKHKSRDFVQIRSYSCDSTMSPEWRYAKDSLNAFSSDHKTKKSVDKRSHECSRESTRSPEWRSSKDRNPVSFENQRNDSSYFQESKSNNGSVSRNRDSSNNFETVIANDKLKDTPLLISRNRDSSRSIQKTETFHLSIKAGTLYR